jgi:hypothetical protein
LITAKGDEVGVAGLLVSGQGGGHLGMVTQALRT